MHLPRHARRQLRLLISLVIVGGVITAVVPTSGQDSSWRPNPLRRSGNAPATPIHISPRLPQQSLTNLLPEEQPPAVVRRFSDASTPPRKLSALEAERARMMSDEARLPRIVHPPPTRRGESNQTRVVKWQDDPFGLGQQQPVPPQRHRQPDLPIQNHVQNAAPAPRPGQEIQIPLHQGGPRGQLNITSQNGRISLAVNEIPIRSVLGLLAERQGLNIVTAADVTGSISLTLKDVLLEDALDYILRVNGYSWSIDRDVILVTKVASNSATPASIQGRIVRVFSLDFLAASDVDEVVKGLLSPAGKSFVFETETQNKRRTREQIVVEDFPEPIQRIEEYLAQADTPPRQVLVEAHVLQVDLQDDLRHGVDLQQLLARVDNARVTFSTPGFVNPDASPSFLVGIDGTDLDALIEALQSTSDVKTLASPKVLVVNGQEARIQIGAQLGFPVTLTTQTGTLQDVKFLDVGVVLNVTPQISHDHRILMTVKPEVSSGQVNPITGLPEEETTEVETTVMLNEGSAMVIGGLIQEKDTENETKIPIAGDLWVVGRLFQRREVSRSRSEIIIALVPRLVPYDAHYQEQEDTRTLRATSPLLGPQLQRNERRPLEPELAEAIRNPRKVRLRRIPHAVKNTLTEPYPHPLEFYVPSVDETCEPRHGYEPRDPTTLRRHENDYYDSQRYIETHPIEGQPAPQYYEQLPPPN